MRQVAYRFTVWKEARRVARDRSPFDRKGPGGEITQPPTAFQLACGAVVERYRIDIKAVWAMCGGALRSLYADVKKQIFDVEQDIARVERRIGSDPKFGVVGAALVCAVVLIGIIAFATILPWVQGWGWILPLSLLAAAALATLEFAFAAAVGAAIGALIWADEPDEAFGLSPRERTAAFVFALLGAVLLVGFSIALAIARGDFGLWAVAGQIAVLLGVAIGVIGYNARHVAEYLRLRMRLRWLQRLELAVAHQYWMAFDRFCAAALWVLRFAERLLLAGARTFAHTWRRRFWRDRDSVIPALPAYALPTDAEIIADLWVPLEPNTPTPPPPAIYPRRRFTRSVLPRRTTH
jgi:hypothetical protein